MYQCYLAAYNKPYLEENLPNQRIITAQVGQIIHNLRNLTISHHHM